MKKNLLLIFLVLIAVLVLSAVSFVEYWSGEHKKNLSSMKELSLDYPELPVPSEGVLLLIYAHSDDELPTIGTVARLKRENPGLKIKWYIVSDGGRGFIYPGTCENLSKEECRMHEARKVSQCANIPLPEGLNLADGKISETKKLKDLLLARIPEFSSGKVKYIFTHDNRGLYGHKDHIAVHEAVSSLAKDLEIKLITLALPKYFKEGLIVMGEAKTRKPAPITHALKLGPQDIEVKICAARAHASQKLILNLLMFQGLAKEEFFKASPREFLNMD